MIRFGLCCKFARQPIRFRAAAAGSSRRLGPAARAEKLALLCSANAAALKSAIEYCAANGIGCFRVPSQVLPLKTHPRLGYEAADLPGGAGIIRAFKACKTLAGRLNVRLTFHPDQFILLSSGKESVTAASIKELDYQALVAGWIGADVINIHGGGGYGDKRSALARTAAALERLSPAARSRLTFENDDRVYTPADLLPFCRKHRIPFVYDIHHHRCLPDGLSAEEVTKQALNTWDREPLFHLSSPKYGWKGADPRPHSDYIDLKDLPSCWRGLDITIEVEAKAKELAIKQLSDRLKTFDDRRH